MKFPFRMVIKCDEEELTAARWEVIEKLRTALLQGAAQRALGEQLQGWLRGRNAKTATPDAWVRAFSAALLTWAQERGERAHATWEYDVLARRCERLEQQLQAYQDDPLQARVERLREARDRWEGKAYARAARIEALEQQLSFTQQRLRQETARLKGEIADLNAIVVRQQEALKQQRS